MADANKAFAHYRWKRRRHEVCNGLRQVTRSVFGVAAMPPV
jgi:hypothetical protein